MSSSNVSDPVQAPTRRSARGGHSGVTSMLSIFLLLLAFFVMLNTLARFETTKTQAVLGSLNATFNIGNPSGQEHEFGSFVGKVGAAQKLQAEAQRLLRTLFGVGRYELIRLGNVVVLDIDADALFRDGALPTPALQVFTSKLSDNILPPSPGTRIQLEVTTYRGTDALEVTDPNRISLVTRRAGAIVRGFQRTGFETGDLVAGIAPGDPRRLRIEFRVIDMPFAPLKVSQ